MSKRVQVEASRSPPWRKYGKLWPNNPDRKRIRAVREGYRPRTSIARLHSAENTTLAGDPRGFSPWVITSSQATLNPMHHIRGAVCSAFEDPDPSR